VHVILASCVMLGRCRRLLRLTSQSLNFTITVTNQPTGKVVGLLHSHERW
jgi:hypothetical protein